MCKKNCGGCVEEELEGRLEVGSLCYRVSEGHTREDQWDEAWEMPVGFGW